MDLNLIKKLIKIVEQSDITELSVQEGELKVSISKNREEQKYAVLGAPPMHHIQSAPVHSAPLAEAQAPVNSNLYEIKSPIVGTFYRASSPDSEPFIKEGDSVALGTVLCIVEAMKLMNEIECDVDGKIVKILVENASPVEYGQPLFLIEKE